ncbi:MAG: Cpe/LpqF family protein [Planctomycetota bacterium]|nr:Cpe/LpqF family protein [Planctomycetota bacterium]
MSTLRALLLLLALLAPMARAQDDEPPKERDPAAIAATPVGKQLTWVLSCINARAASDAEGRFTPRFLEQFTMTEVKELLSSLRDRAFKGSEVSLIEHEANPRPDALSCVIGNEDAERYLSLLLAVNEDTGKIAGMTFTASLSARDAADGGWNDLAGDMGQLQTGVWFGAYQINFEAPGTKDADVRIREVYEFGNRRRLNVSTASRIYLLNIAASKIADGSFQPSTPLSPTTSTLAQTLPLIAKGDLDAADLLAQTLTRQTIEDALSQLQEEPDLSLPYLTFAEWTRLKSPDHQAALANYLLDNGTLRRSMLAPGGEVAQLVAAINIKAPTPWTTPVEIQKVGWFATNKEAAYAVARLALLEQDPKVMASGLSTSWRQPQAAPTPAPNAAPATTTPRLTLDLDPKIWIDHLLIRGSEPGCQTLLLLLKRHDNHYFTQVVTWNNTAGPLDEPRLYELAQKGIEILAADQPPAPKPALPPAVKPE